MLRPNKIVILGGGSAGWMSAATLIRTFPGKDIVLVESPDVSSVGVGESTIAGIRGWVKYIGIDETEFFRDTSATYKMSIKFTDFYKKGDGGFHYPFGHPQFELGRNPHLDWNMKKYFFPDTTVTDYVECLFPSSALFLNQKFSWNTLGEFDSYNPDRDLAYHFDAVKFGLWLRDKYCIPAGVEHIQGTVTSVNTNEDGVESLVLSDGTVIEGDLFVDCTGFKSMLLGEALNEPFTSWNDILPNNNAVACHLPYKDKEKEMQLYTNCTALGNGWVWNVPLWSRIGTGYVYSDKFTTYEDAVEEFKQHLMSDDMIVPRTREEVDALTFRNVPFRVGMYERTFVKNVVAIGLSAGFIEPLESNGLYSVHEFLLRLIDVLRYKEIPQAYVDMYNVRVKYLFTTFSKFISQHYYLSHRDDTPYWKHVTSTSFTGHEGEPFNDHIARSDTYANLANLYIDEWGHPIDLSGIPYISVGLGMQMMSDYRVQNMSQRMGIDFEAATKSQMVTWEAQKSRWNKAAKKAPTIIEYMQKTFYPEELDGKNG